MILKKIGAFRLLASISNLNQSFITHHSQLTASQLETVNGLFEGLVNNKRPELARAITLVETSNPVKKAMAQVLLNKLLLRLKENKENNAKVCLRIGGFFIHRIRILMIC
jgi:hypothetical protein